MAFMGVLWLAGVRLVTILSVMIIMGPAFFLYDLSSAVFR